MKKGSKKYIDEDGNILYKFKELLHRTDGPAVEWINGERQWWLKGLLHRTDGPAIVLTNGEKRWWLKGIEYTEEEYNNKIKEYK